MNEADLKRKLVAVLRRELAGAVVLRHEDKFRAGVPDISVTWGWRTVWVEVKFDRPGARPRLTEIQRRTLRRLGGLLVTYYATGSGERGVRVDGQSVAEPCLSSAEFAGFDHQAVVEAVQEELGA